MGNTIAEGDAPYYSQGNQKKIEGSENEMKGRSRGR